MERQKPRLEIVKPLLPEDQNLIKSERTASDIIPINSKNTSKAKLIEASKRNHPSGR